MKRRLHPRRMRGFKDAQQKVVRAGNIAVLDDKNPHIQNTRDGTMIKLDVKSGVYTMEMREEHFMVTPPGEEGLHRRSEVGNEALAEELQRSEGWRQQNNSRTSRISIARIERNPE